MAVLKSDQELVTGWKQLDVQSGFLIIAKTQIAKELVSQLIDLYQPLMGASAYGLYAYLVANIDYKPLLSKRRAHRELLTNLGIDLPSFYEARIKLEALGLLRTFVQEDSLGKVYLYEVQSPLSGPAFLADDLMAALLLETVGQRRFEQLEKKYHINVLRFTNTKEITKSLIDVYKLDNEDNLYTQKNVTGISQTKKNSITDVEVSLDKEFLRDLLVNSFVDEQVLVENYDALKTVHLLYGLDELQIVKLLERATNVSTNQVDLTKFKRIAHQEFNSKINNGVSKVTVVEPTISDSHGMTSEDLQLITACQAYLPLEFLEKLKGDMGTFATKNEQYLVKNLVERQTLPNAVINILIHYLLSDQDHAYFGSNFESIAADWAKKQIKTPEDAIRQVRSFYETKAKRASQRKIQKSKRAIIQKESLPDWAKPGYQEEQRPDDPAKSEKIAELMAKIKQKD